MPKEGAVCCARQKFPLPAAETNNTTPANTGIVVFKGPLRRDEGEMREGIVAKNQPSSFAKGAKELEQHNQYLVPQKLFKKCELPLRLLEVFLSVRAILALQRGLRLGHVGLHSTLCGNHVTAQSVALSALRAL